jgi:hypothetical protein
LLTLYGLVVVGLFVWLIFWAAEGTGKQRALIAVFGPAIAFTVFPALMYPPLLPGTPLLFVAASVGMSIVIVPGIWAVRSGFQQLTGGSLGASVTLLTLLTTALGFGAGAAIVLLTIGALMKKCC